MVVYWELEALNWYVNQMSKELVCMALFLLNFLVC